MIKRFFSEEVICWYVEMECFVMVLIKGDDEEVKV